MMTEPSSQHNNAQNTNTTPQPLKQSQDTYWGNPPQTPQANRAYGHYPSALNQPVGYPQIQQPQQQPPQQPPFPSAVPTAPATPQKKQGFSTKALVILIVLAIVLSGIGSCAAYWMIVENVLSSTSSTLTQSSSSNDPATLLSTEVMNNNFRYRYSLDDDKTDALSKHELSQVNALLAGDNPTSSDTKHQPGVYYIGKDMPAGSYWVEGNDTQVTYYFVLQTEQNTSSKEAYNVSNGNHYYGHNIIEVSEGDVLVIEEEAVPLNQMNEKFSAPYKSGMYRVGIDIPAGTYTLSAGKADDLYGYFIMKDLSYSETSYLEQSYFMNMNEHPTITLNEGTYIELYNLTMKPSTVTT